MSDLEDIRRQRKRWITAVTSRDVNSYVELLTKDIVWFPPGQTAISGQNAFKSWVQPFFERFHYEFTIIDPIVLLAGDWAVERGSFKTRMTSGENTNGGHHEGRYLVLWRRETDAVWRIERYLDETPQR